ncbi:MAG: HAD-IA family hydrolase, partial [Bacteroidales bacterium]|nr:HAD-IA family hydrolase [Bacteroidales bacterium]
KVQEKLIERRNNYSRKFHKLDETGGSLKALISLFSKLMIPFEHAVDIGCGEGGDLSLMLSHQCRQVSAVDIQPEIISGLKKILAEKNITNVRPIEADMTRIPLPDASADLVLMSQVLHHASSPWEALKEGVRLLKPSGTLALLDLAQHNEEELRETHGHIWLGFDQKRIEFLLNLRKKHKIFLLSNTNQIHYEYYNSIFKKEFGFKSLDSIFEKAYYSHQIGYRKPDFKAFEFVLKNSQLEPKETIFIDDNKENIEVANQIGIKTLCLENNNLEFLNLYDYL